MNWADMDATEFDATLGTAAQRREIARRKAMPDQLFDLPATTLTPKPRLHWASESDMPAEVPTLDGQTGLFEAVTCDD